MAAIQIKRYTQEANIPAEGLNPGEFILALDSKKLFLCTSETEKIVVNQSGGGLIVTDYAGIVSLIGSNQLVAGQEYIIADFATTHYLLDRGFDYGTYWGYNPDYYVTMPINTGDVEPIIVKALSGNSLSHHARSVIHGSDIIFYDWNPENWSKDVSFARFDNFYGTIIENFKGVIYYRHDTLKDVEVTYDFRAVKMRRWAQINPEWDPLTSYQAYAYVNTSEGLYKSLKQDNLGNNPSTSMEWWGLVLTPDQVYVNWNSSFAVGTSDPLNFQDVYTFSHYEAVRSVHLLSPVNQGFYDGQPSGVKSIIKGVVFDCSRYTESGDQLAVSNLRATGNIFEMSTFAAMSVKDVSFTGRFDGNVIAAGFLESSNFGIFRNNTLGYNCSILASCNNFYSNDIFSSVTNVIVSVMSGNSIAGIVNHVQAVNLMGNYVKPYVYLQFSNFLVFNYNKVTVTVQYANGSCIAQDFTGGVRISSTYSKELIRTTGGTNVLRYITNTSQYITAANA